MSILIDFEGVREEWGVARPHRKLFLGGSVAEKEFEFGNPISDRHSFSLALDIFSCTSFLLGFKCS